MKIALVIMTLMGCDCDMQVCQVIQPAGTASWNTVEECEAAIPTAILRESADYPSIVGRCSSPNDTVSAAPVVEAVGGS